MATPRQPQDRQQNRVERRLASKLGEDNTNQRDRAELDRLYAGPLSVDEDYFEQDDREPVFEDKRDGYQLFVRDDLSFEEIESIIESTEEDTDEAFRTTVAAAEMAVGKKAFKEFKTKYQGTRKSSALYVNVVNRIVYRVMTDAQETAKNH